MAPRTRRAVLALCCLLGLVALIIGSGTAIIVGHGGQPSFVSEPWPPVQPSASATAGVTGASTRLTPGRQSVGTGKATKPAELAQWTADAAWFQRLIYLYASANAPIQQAAAQAGGSAGLSDVQASQVTLAVRQTWVALMSADPASIGRPDTKPNPTAQHAVLTQLRATLQQVTGDHYTTFLGATDTIYTLTSSAAWLSSNGLNVGQAPAGASRMNLYTTVYATSFSIPGDNSAYVALPDVYVKYANLGLYSNIPSLYQPYYLQNGTLPAPYTVDIVSLANALNAPRVPIKDVGPWNEDDNWWDATNNSTVLPPSCPVSSTLVSAQSLSNAAVDGICPGLNNWRRVYYYLLYQHVALPFFQPAGYSPTGAYADATAWPPALLVYCPEASAASTNNDNVACASSFPNYNANAGAWLRAGTYNSPVVNQAGIDLSPGVDAALGWTWPSSGFVGINLSRLP